MGAGIKGIGIYLPQKVITSSYIEKKLNMSEGWIEKRSGIRERRQILSNQEVSDLGAIASLKAIEDAGLKNEDIGFILVASSSPEMVWPSTASIIQKKLGISDIPCLDIQAVCSNFVYGLEHCCLLVPKYQNILFICAEAITRFLNEDDQGTYPLFGDGAAALVIGNVKEGYGVLSSKLGADGTKADLLYIPAGGSAIPFMDKGSHSIYMDGQEVFKLAIDIPAKITKEILSENSISLDEVKFFIPHQANQRIIDAYKKEMELVDKGKVFSNIEKYGNTSSASIPIAFFELYESGLLENGDLVVTVGFGAGFTWGVNIIRWYLTEEER